MRPTCTKHPAAFAGWQCDACGAVLCPDCTGSKFTNGARFEACLACGGFARQIKVPRSELYPFSIEQLIGTLRWPFTKMGVLALCTWAVLLTVLSLFGGRASAIGTGLLVAYLFQFVRHTASGHDDFPGPDDFGGYLEDVIAPSLRLGVALAWIWLPALLWVAWAGPPREDPGVEQQRMVEKALRPGGPGLMMRGMKVVRTPTGIEVVPGNAAPPPPSAEQQEELKREEEEEKAAQARELEARAGVAPPEGEAREGGSPAEADLRQPPPPKVSIWKGPLVPLLLTLFGIVLAPMSLLASSLKTPLRVAANPLVLAGYAIKLGRDYALLVGFCLAATLSWLAVRGIGTAVFHGSPFVRLPISFISLVLAFAAFRGIGLFVRARGVDLGYGGESESLVPVLGNVAPGHELGGGPALGQEAQGQAAQPSTGGRSAGFRSAPAPIELEPELAAEPGAPLAGPAAQLGRLCQLKDLDGAVALLEQAGAALTAAAVSASSWMELAQAALQRGLPRSGVLALRRCLDAAPEGPLAPQAWLLAARVYDEQLADPKTSNRLLSELAKRFPESNEGRFATRRLAQLPERNAG
jgi:hypothetical protein